MNLSMIRYILGYVLAVEGLLMAPCSLVGLIYGEQEGWWFLAVGAVSLALGLLIARKKPSSQVFYLKEGCVSTALCWIIMSAVGAISTRVPAIAMTDAAEAAMPSILTVTLPL